MLMNECDKHILVTANLTQCHTVLFHSIIRCLYCLSTILDISTIVHEEIRELEMKLSSNFKKLIIFGCSQLQILKIP